MKLKVLLSGNLALLIFLSLLSFPGRLTAQNSLLMVTGKITDESGKGLAGITILVKGTSSQTSSLEVGSFNIDGLSDKESLVFTSIGYLQQEIPVNNQSVINHSPGIPQKVRV